MVEPRWIAAAVALPFVLQLSSACGGTAVVEGAGGAGTTSTSTASTTSTTTNDVASSSTGNDPHAANCEVLCDALVASGCQDGTCYEACVFGASDACGAAYAELIACFAHNLPADPCNAFPAACEVALHDLDVCQNPGCPPDECGNGDPGASCYCTGSCLGSTYNVTCIPQDDMSLACTCTWDNQVLGECSELAGCPNDMYVGCCAAFFPLPD